MITEAVVIGNSAYNYEELKKMKLSRSDRIGLIDRVSPQGGFSIRPSSSRVPYGTAGCSVSMMTRRGTALVCVCV